MKRATNPIQVIKNLFRYLLLVTAFLIIVFISSLVLGYFITKTTEISDTYSLPFATIIVSFLSKSFFETLIRLYNYTQNRNKKLSRHAIFMADSSKLFSVVATIVILFENRDVYSDIERIGVIGFVSIVVTIAIYGLGMILVESDLISESNKISNDSQETELIKSFRSLTDAQKSEIQQSINSKLDK